MFGLLKGRSAGDSDLPLTFCVISYLFNFFLVMPATPNNPAPNKNMEAGSGTGATSPSRTAKANWVAVEPTAILGESHQPHQKSNRHASSSGDDASRVPDQYQGAISSPPKTPKLIKGAGSKSASLPSPGGPSSTYLR